VPSFLWEQRKENPSFSVQAEINPYKPGKVQEVTTLIPNESVDLIVARPEEGLAPGFIALAMKKR
jgi:hypothetical protein